MKEFLQFIEMILFVPTNSEPSFPETVLLRDHTIHFQDPIQEKSRLDVLEDSKIELGDDITSVYDFRMAIEGP
jgi:hypothetical protein